MVLCFCKDFGMIVCKHTKVAKHGMDQGTNFIILYIAFFFFNPGVGCWF